MKSTVGWKTAMFSSVFMDSLYTFVRTKNQYHILCKITQAIDFAMDLHVANAISGFSTVILCSALFIIHVLKI